jgi:hypothetical protein
MLTLLTLTLLQVPPQVPEDLIGQWKACLTTRAERYASLSEPAETVATAALSACKEHEQALRRVPAHTNYPEMIEIKQKLVDDMVKDQRGKLVQLVLDRRLAKKL